MSCDLGETEDQIEEYATGGSGLQNLGGGDEMSDLGTLFSRRHGAMYEWAVAELRH